MTFRGGNAPCFVCKGEPTGFCRPNRIYEHDDNGTKLLIEPWVITQVCLKLEQKRRFYMSSGIIAEKLFGIKKRRFIREPVNKLCKNYALYDTDGKDALDFYTNQCLKESERISTMEHSAAMLEEPVVF